MAEKKVYLCDCGPVDKPRCRKETQGFHLTLPGDSGIGLDKVRFDLCDYHSRVFWAAIHGGLDLPRDHAEAACP